MASSSSLRRASSSKLALRRSSSDLAVDRGLAEADAGLSERATPVKGVYARLVQIDAAKSLDQYHVLQGLEDTSAAGDSRFFSFQRWGSTGSRGQSKVEGPMRRDEVEALLARVFEEKTGSAWGTMKPGDRAKPGKYWVQQQAAVDLKATWEYYVDDRVDGKCTDWYPYLKEASDEVEEIFAQHEANKREARTQRRVVQSGHFSYRVDLDAMTQTNTRTGKLRQIRRKLGARITSRGSLPRAMKATKARKTATSMKVMKATKARTVVKAMKATKAAKATKIAKKKPMKLVKKNLTNKATRKLVYNDKLKSTKTGLKKAQLTKNKKGKIVSAKKSELAKSHKWIQAVTLARKEKRYSGPKRFKRGTSFHDKATEIHEQLKKQKKCA